MWWQSGSLMIFIPLLLSPHLFPWRWKKTVCSYLLGCCNTLVATAMVFKDCWCVCVRQSEAGSQRALTCAHAYMWVWVTGSSMSVYVHLCVLVDILKRCKVKVHVSSTQLSPSELFIKIPHSSFSCCLSTINLAKPVNLKAVEVCTLSLCCVFIRQKSFFLSDLSILKMFVKNLTS